jgi:outer membrane protein
MRIHQSLVVTFLAVAVAATGFAQTPLASPAPQYVVEPEKKKDNADLLDAPLLPTKGWFRTRFDTPSTRVELQPIQRISDFVVNDRLELSIRDYIQLVMLNNTDIAIQRLNVEIPRNAITRAFSPFDPTLTTSFNSRRVRNPITNQLQGGDTAVSTLTQPFNANYTQLLPTGTIFTSGFSADKTSTSDRFAVYNPALRSNMAWSFSQPLLRDRGAVIQKLPITIARSRLRQSEYQMRDQVMRTLAQAENVYWSAVSARENLALQQKFLELRDAALKRAQRELELGALSPLDIYQPQAEFASAEVAVIQARYQLAQQEDALRRQIGADLMPDYRQVPIELTEPVSPPTAGPNFDREESVARAMQFRPDLRAVNQSLDIDDLRIRQATNSLRPSVNLVGGYTAQGRGGNFLMPNGSVVPGGLGDAFSQMFGFGFPVYTFGLQMNLPVRDRRAAADLADATVQKKLDSLVVRNVEQLTRLEVLTAINQVEASAASVKQALIARDFAQKRFDAEQKKYDLGTTVLFFVLDAQTQLNRAESDLLNQSINYRRNLVQLYRTTGELLDRHNVTLQ